MRGFQIIVAVLSIIFLNAVPLRKNAPNILFIMSDDHTSQAWGIYGGLLAPYKK